MQTILLAGVYGTVRRQIRDFLEPKGYQIREAKSRQEVLDTHAGLGDQLHLVVFHNAWPRQWFDIARTIRVSKEGATLPFLFLSVSQEAERAACAGLGCVHFLEVPFSWQTFERELNGLLGGHGESKP